jgi:hypothetical protein
MCCLPAMTVVPVELSLIVPGGKDFRHSNRVDEGAILSKTDDKP